jgi:hypothetical protein
VATHLVALYEAPVSHLDGLAPDLETNEATFCRAAPVDSLLFLDVKRVQSDAVSMRVGVVYVMLPFNDIDGHALRCFD